jgi:hypothetical protein
MTRAYLSFIIIAAAFGAGWWAGAWTQESRHIRAMADQQMDDAKTRTKINADEAMRLAKDADLDVHFQEVVNAARYDADGGLVAISVRDAQRLNALR